MCIYARSLVHVYVNICLCICKALHTRALIQTAFTRARLKAKAFSEAPPERYYLKMRRFASNTDKMDENVWKIHFFWARICILHFGRLKCQFHWNSSYEGFDSNDGLVFERISEIDRSDCLKIWIGLCELIISLVTFFHQNQSEFGGERLEILWTAFTSADFPYLLSFTKHNIYCIMQGRAQSILDFGCEIYLVEFMVTHSVYNGRSYIKRRLSPARDFPPTLLNRSHLNYLLHIDFLKISYIYLLYIKNI